MDKSVAGLIGAVSVLVATAPAHAATAFPMTPQTVLQASSYSDLLKPIPNALALLKASAAARVETGTETSTPEADGRIQDVQFHHHHHHHHHYRWRHRRYHHHHHHHHHHDDSL